MSPTLRLLLPGGMKFVKDEQTISIPGDAGRRSLEFGPNGIHASFCVTRNGKTIQYVDGREGPACDGITNFIYSGDGNRFAYAAEKNGQLEVVVDGVEGPEGDGMVENSLAFSADGKHASYVALDAKATKWVLREDGKVKKEFPILGETSLGQMIADRQAGRTQFNLGNSVNYLEWSRPYSVAMHVSETSPAPKDWETLMAEGMRPKNQPLRDDWMDVFYNPAAQRLVYLTSTGGREYAVVDGKADPEYDAIDPTFHFSPDGKHLAYVATKAGKLVVVADGREIPDDDINPDTVSFLPQTGALIYAVQSATGSKVIWDGKAGPAFDALGYSLIISPDGKHFAYTGVRGGQWTVVVDGQPGPAYGGLALVMFTPDNRPDLPSSAKERNGPSGGGWARGTVARSAKNGCLHPCFPGRPQRGPFARI